ncbi:MAG: hypothetical protein ROO71_02820 [Balneola sp.]
MKIKKVNIALTIALLLISCKSNSSSSESEKENTLYPIEIGNEWTYEINDSGSRSAYRNTVEESKDINENTYYIVSTYYVEDSRYFEDSYAIRNTNDGTYLGWYFDGEYFDDLFFPYPVEDGFQYNYSGDNSEDYEIAVREESIVVPSGVYEVYTYSVKEFRDNGGYWLYNYSFSPGIGLVQEIDSSYSGSGELEFEFYQKLASTNVE